MRVGFGFSSGLRFEVSGGCGSLSRPLDGDYDPPHHDDNDDGDDNDHHDSASAGIGLRG
jgi:hypothetical protein